MKPALLFLFLIAGTLKSYSQTINCNNSEAKASLKAMWQNYLQMRQDFNQKMKTLKTPQDSAIYVPWLIDMQKQDMENQKRVSALLDQCGWPEKLDSTENLMIYTAIFHGDASQIKKYLPLVYRKMRQGVVQKSEYAVMADRSLVYEIKKQVYGTQTYRNRLSGITTVWPIEEIAQLDNRRKAMSLQPMNEYIAMLNSGSIDKIAWNRTLTLKEAKKTSPKNK